MPHSITPGRSACLLYNNTKMHSPSAYSKGKMSDRNNTSQGVISSVTAPTERFGSHVVKPNGSVRIFVDMNHLNKAVQREIHSIPSVD